MKDDTVVALRQPESFSDDPLTEILRAGARQLLGQAIEAEVAAHIEAHADLTEASGRRRIVRHGHMPEREVQTGIGAVTVKRPRVRDRDPQATGGRIRFTSSILPPYLRRAKSVEALLPWLYLKGISSGDFSEALAALLGPDAPGLTASTIGRLKAVWWDEYEAWQKRDLWARRYVYFWADGVYFSPRMDHDKQCVLVIIGADAMGNKDIVGMVDGYRESAQSWKELLLDLKRRGLETGPELAVGDGALGFWKALREVYGETRVQRCWVHKTANVLNQMPKSLQAKAKGHLHDIWMAETRADAEAAFDFFIAAYGAKYHKAAERLVKDRERLLSFYDFPAEHWKHIRTTNPIESTFATVRLRTVKTKGCLSRKTVLAMAFKLILSARRKWRKLDGSNQLAELVEGVPFKDGIKITKHACQWRSKKGPPRRCKKGPLGGCGLVPVVHGRAPRADAACPQQADAAARAGGTCGPTGSSVGWVVGSVSSRGLTPAALVEPVAVTVHLEDVDVVGEAIEERAGEALGAEHLGPFVEGQIGGDQGRAPLVALAEHLEQQLRRRSSTAARSRVRRRSEACRWRASSGTSAAACHRGPR